MTKRTKDDVLDFAKRWQSEDASHINLSEDVLDVFAEFVGDNLRNTFYNIYTRHLTDSPATYLRASMLDSHALIMLSQKFLPSGSVKTAEEISRKSKATLGFGTLFEHICMMEMLLDGWQIVDTQPSLTMYDGLVSGHPDLIAKTPSGEEVLIEFKTSNDNYWRQIANSKGDGMDDERGYILQLALYQREMKLPAYWLVFNKDTSMLYAEKLSERKAEKALKRADKRVAAYHRCESWDKMFMMCPIPEPMPEIYKGERTGRYTVPFEFRGTAVGDWIYETVADTNGYGEPRNYVTAICMPEESYEKQSHLHKEFDSIIQFCSGSD